MRTNFELSGRVTEAARRRLPGIVSASPAGPAAAVKAVLTFIGPTFARFVRKAKGGKTVLKSRMVRRKPQDV